MSTIQDTNRLSYFKDAVYAYAEIGKDAMSSLRGRVGFVLGAAIPLVSIPLLNRMVKAWNLPTYDPFANLNLGVKVLITPFVCVIGPIMEEQVFRQDLKDKMIGNIEKSYLDWGLSKVDANFAARTTTIFYTSVIFGLVHFSNSLCFFCNPIYFLPQVIFATVAGFVFGVAEDFGGLEFPIGLHIGNNTSAWVHYLLNH
ncbi:CPBP family intramembrane glutamic endopeptidase [Simkania sp.]|uniref:CPBP family intramembrane glutamic endopeptidase n=1 Tax=Simkania sp. TaxID=34094 RepID=UPI003B5234CF